MRVKNGCVAPEQPLPLDPVRHGPDLRRRQPCGDGILVWETQRTQLINMKSLDKLRQRIQFFARTEVPVMGRPPELGKEPARREIPRATRSDACAVCSSRRRFVFSGLSGEPERAWSRAYKCKVAMRTSKRGNEALCLARWRALLTQCSSGPASIDGVMI